MNKRNLYYAAVILATISGIAVNDAMSQVSNGRVTTSPPTYGNNTTAPLSLDTAGNLRISGSISASTEADASATPPTYSPGPEPLSQTLSGELRVLPTPNGTQDVDVTATVGLTDTELRASPVPVSGPLTDTQLRATPVPVSGTVAVSAIAGALPAGTNNIGDVDVATLPSIPAGSNAIGSVGAVAVSTIGASVSIATTATVIKGSAGTLHAVQVFPNGGGPAVTYYDNASACSGTIRLVAFGSASGGPVAGLVFSNPIAFSNGITACATATTSTTALYQ